MDLGLKGAKVLVTGSTKGIGRAIADTFAAEGADVGICARNKADVDSAVTETRRAVAELGMKAIFIRPNIHNGRPWHDRERDRRETEEGEGVESRHHGTRR